ncbi:MAG TPA: phosphoribosylglycinamide formyltransferase [Gemmatales bacterium]|nr:phosphoribosylglycinamide formyltransferase [Gemmatales bacterium]
MPLRLAVLISGSGSTLQNLMDHQKEGKLLAEIVTVVSSRAQVAGLDKARQAGLPAIVIERKGKSLQPFADEIYKHLRQIQIDLVCLAGFLEFLPIPEDFTNKVINIHPSLIPAFCGKGYYGRHVHEAVIRMGVKISGCTVHFADNEYDHGPIILQKAIPVRDEDTPESLAKRVFAAECDALPEAINLIAENRVIVRNNRTWVNHSD